MGTTHAPIGAVAGLTSLRLLELAGVHIPVGYPEADMIAGGVGLITALMPDIDQPSSIIANPGRQTKNIAGGLGLRHNSLGYAAVALPLILINFPVHLLATFIRATLGHRGVMHSFGVAIVVTALFAAASIAIGGWGWWVGGVFAASGYASHLLSDDMTHSTMPLFWPIYRRKMHLLPLPMRCGASGIVNRVLGVVATLAALVIAISPGGWGQLWEMARRVFGQGE